jgi:hypothetical protein
MRLQRAGTPLIPGSVGIRVIRAIRVLSYDFYKVSADIL